MNRDPDFSSGLLGSFPVSTICNMLFAIPVFLNVLLASEKIMSTSAVELCSLTHGIIFERPHAEGKEY
jgi:hypothetical protein